MGVKKEPFSFERLMDPYRQGGTENRPVDRTIGIVIDWLVNRCKYPPDIVGGAILIVFSQLYHKEVEFRSTGKWGSAGSQLDNYIRKKCAELLERQNTLQQRATAATLAGNVITMLRRTRRDKFRSWMRTGHWR